MDECDDCAKNLARPIQWRIHQRTSLESRYSECSHGLSPIISNIVMIAKDANKKHGDDNEIAKDTNKDKRQFFVIKSSSHVLSPIISNMAMIMTLRKIQTKTMAKFLHKM